MKKVLLVIILSMFFSSGAGASEITGSISTNPGAVSGNNPPVEEPVIIAPAPIIQNSGGSGILPIQNQPASQLSENQTAEIRPVAADTRVLGEKIYPDGTLLRAGDRKIYIIQDQAKKQIANLKELEKYRGRAIIKTTAEELSKYQTRGHLNGQLIRQRGEIRVYEIVKGGKHHILNLAELRTHYFGKEIFNISSEEMALY